MRSCGLELACLQVAEELHSVCHTSTDSEAGGQSACGPPAFDVRRVMNPG